MKHEGGRRPHLLGRRKRTWTDPRGLLIVFLSGILGCSAFVGDEYGRLRTWRCPLPRGSVREVSLLSLEDSGQWLMVMVTRREMPPAELALVFRSEDRGVHWSNPDTLGVFPFTQITFRPMRTSDGVVVGLLILSRSPSDPGHRGFLVVSTDHGKMWHASHPISLGEDVRIRFLSGPFEVAPGQWGILCRIQRRGRWGPVLLTTSDRGLHWTSRPLGGEWMMEAEEAVVGVNPEGEWTVLFSRPGSPFLETVHSDDFGQTWRDLNQTPLYGEVGRLILTRHGTQVAVYRDPTPPALSLKLSFDRGRTWEAERVLSAFPVLFEGKEIPFDIAETERGMAALWILPETGEATFAEVALSPPPAPRGVSVSASPRGTILRWNAVPGCAYYLVFGDTLPDFQPVFPPDPKANLLARVPTCHYTAASMDTSRTLYYRVCGVRGTGRLELHTGAIGAFSAAVGVSRPISVSERKSP